MDEQINLQQDISLGGAPGMGELDIYQYFTASPYFAGFSSHSSPEMKVFLGLYKTLPDSLRQFIASDTTASLIFTTGQSYSLDDDQIFNLAKSVRELLIGDLFIKDFPTTISSRLGIDDVKASEISNKLISASFSPILEDVKRIQRNKFPDKIAQLQKESRPEGLTSKPQISAEVKQMPLNRPTSAPVSAPVQPQAPQSAQILTEPLKPLQASPTPPPQPIQATPATPVRPPLSIPRPEGQRPPIQTLPQRNEQEPKQAAPLPILPQKNVGTPRPEFKIPDLGPSSPVQTKPLTQNEPPKSSAQESLEAELEKVASVIDLRAKSGE